jgi:DNA-binding MarR family transcriptional regulator
MAEISMADPTPIEFYDQVPETSIAEVFDLIDHTAKNLRRIQRQTVSQTGLTPPQYQVLHQLWQQDGRPFKDLAEASLCSRATITGIIDILERKGLVTRQPNPADRRSLLATLTDAGRELRYTTPSLGEIFTSCCDVLAPHELQQLGLLLSKLNESLT